MTHSPACALNSSSFPPKNRRGARGLRPRARRSGARSFLGIPARTQMAIWDMLVGDDIAPYETAAAIEHGCRRHGAIGVLPVALLLRARAEMHLGRHRDA